MKQPQHCLHDPVLLAQITQAQAVELSSYLICLAAYQRGLSVTFHRTLAQSIFRFTTYRGVHGELFSISDGKDRHYFSRSLGDLTSIEAAHLTKDKHQTKERLNAAGVLTPIGITLFKEQTTLAEQYLQTHIGDRFVVKPFNGSLSRGIHTNLTANQVIQVLQNHPSNQLILEQYIKGREYRVTVVNGRVIAVYEREAANITGNSGKTIETLTQEKNILRKSNPVFRSDPIPLNQSVIDHLCLQGLTLESILPQGKKIYLSTALNRRDGADYIDRTESAGESLQRVAMQACEAVGVPNAGLDLIVEEQGGHVYVLEVNARAGIAPHTYPLFGRGTENNIAEAIVDMYFPQSKANKRFPHSIIYITAVLAALKNGIVADVTLPTLSADWEHKRLHLGSDLSPNNAEKIHIQLLYLGLYGQIFQEGQKDSYLDVVGPKSAFEGLLKTT